MIWQAINSYQVVGFVTFVYEKLNFWNNVWEVGLLCRSTYVNHPFVSNGVTSLFVSDPSKEPSSYDEINTIKQRFLLKNSRLDTFPTIILLFLLVCVPFGSTLATGFCGVLTTGIWVEILPCCWESTLELFSEIPAGLLPWSKSLAAGWITASYKWH